MIFGIDEMVENSGSFLDSVGEFFSNNAGIIAATTGAVVVGAGAYWAYNQSEKTEKLEKANKALNEDLGKLKRSATQNKAMLKALAEKQGLKYEDLIKKNKEDDE